MGLFGNPQLPSTINSPQVERQVRRAARELLGPIRIETIFEHGHWWVRERVSGDLYDAVDAEGPGSAHGFGFERIK